MFDWRMVAGFTLLVVVIEVAILEKPTVAVKKVVTDREWLLPQLIDKTDIASLAGDAAQSLVWGLSSSTESLSQPKWQLKGVVRSGELLIALVSVDNRIQRVKVNDSLGEGKVQEIRETGITLIVRRQDGSIEEQHVKVHQ